MQRQPGARVQVARRLVLSGSVAAGAMGMLSIPASRAAPPSQPWRVLHVDSYHRGNEWNDRIAAAVERKLSTAGADVRVFHMDTKRKPTEADKEAAAREGLALIDDFQPHVVTMSDDNAVKYLLMPYFRDAELPFVFCGLNWDASVYGLPYGNTTGMVEVSPIPQLISLLQAYTDGRRLGYLAEDTPTKHKEKAFHEKLFGIEYRESYFVSSFPEWTDAFERAQDEVDILLLLGVGALTDWDDATARTVAETQTRIPTGTDFGWLMPYALLGVAKLPEEQGDWAAEAAIKILEGVTPLSIPVTHNRKGELLFNPRIADVLAINDAPPLARLIE